MAGVVPCIKVCMGGEGVYYCSKVLEWEFEVQKMLPQIISAELCCVHLCLIRSKAQIPKP